MDVVQTGERMMEKGKGGTEKRSAWVWVCADSDAWYSASEVNKSRGRRWRTAASEPNKPNEETGKRGGRPLAILMGQSTESKQRRSVKRVRCLSIVRVSFLLRSRPRVSTSFHPPPAIRHSLPLLLYNLYVTRTQNPTLLILGEDAGLRRGDARRLRALLGVDHAGLRLLYRMHTRAFDASLVSAGVALNVGTD